MGIITCKFVGFDKILPRIYQRKVMEKRFWSRYITRRVRRINYSLVNILLKRRIPECIGFPFNNNLKQKTEKKTKQNKK